MIKKNKTKKNVLSIFKMSEEDFSKENLIEGGLIRPIVLMVSFFIFVLSMFLLLTGDLKWGGSGIIFAFVLNLFSIYESLKDKPSLQYLRKIQKSTDFS